MMDYAKLTEAFVVTAVWDVILRLFATKQVRILGIERWNWVHALEGYFHKHTVLAAALLAGFAGAIAFAVIQLWTPPSMDNFNNVVAYALWIIVVSALVGVPMRYSGLFPHLKKYYYDKLPLTTIFSDALSGVIVAVTMLSIDGIRRWCRTSSL